jgi:hypothetical protein
MVNAIEKTNIVARIEKVPTGAERKAAFTWKEKLCSNPEV